MVSPYASVKERKSLLVITINHFMEAAVLLKTAAFYMLQ